MCLVCCNEGLLRSGWLVATPGKWAKPLMHRLLSRVTRLFFRAIRMFAKCIFWMKLSIISKRQVITIQKDTVFSCIILVCKGEKNILYQGVVGSLHVRKKAGCLFYFPVPHPLAGSEDEALQRGNGAMVQITGRAGLIFDMSKQKKPG